MDVGEERAAAREDADGDAEEIEERATDLREGLPVDHLFEALDVAQVQIETLAHGAPFCGCTPS